MCAPIPNMMVRMNHEVLQHFSLIPNQHIRATRVAKRTAKNDLPEKHIKISRLLNRCFVKVFDFFGSVGSRLRWGKRRRKPTARSQRGQFRFLSNYNLNISSYRTNHSLIHIQRREYRKKLLMKNLVCKTDLHNILFFFFVSSFANIHPMNIHLRQQILIYIEKSMRARRDKIRLSTEEEKKLESWRVHVICIVNLSAVWCVHR